MSDISAASPIHQSLDRVHDYYCTPREVSSDQRHNIYEIWEAGGAFNDSVTPSTYCPEYRSHMVAKITSLTGRQSRIFSIGCGNAFVEAELVKQGRFVQGIDCNDEATELAASKGVDAFTADFFALPAGHLAGFDLVYADGLLGHLYQADRGLDAFFDHLKALGPAPGAHLVFSNDAPLEPHLPTQPHARVEDFWFLSRGYLRTALTGAGLEDEESYYFPYTRPLSGLRNRTICVGRVGPADAAGR